MTSQGPDIKQNLDLLVVPEHCFDVTLADFE